MDRIILDGAQQIQGYAEIKQIEVRLGKRQIIYTPKSLWELVEWAFSREDESMPSPDEPE